MNTPIRTFIAVLLSDELKHRIASVQDEFKNVAPDFKWVEPENFHVTVKFLGNVPESRIQAIEAATERAADRFVPFDLEISGAGAFPNPRRPRVVWVGLTTGTDALKGLVERVEREMIALGFPKEDKPFKAHITIGRARENGLPVDISRAIDETDTSILGVQHVDRIAVMQSELKPKGPIYTSLREIRLLEPAGGVS